MKKIITLIGFFILLFQFQNSYCQDYLETATAQGSGITTDNSRVWTDLVSVTIDVTNISNVLLTASINMRPDGVHTGGREGNYNIYRSDLVTDNSGGIERQMIANTDGTGVESWGIGTLVHIFDTSTLSGNVTYILEHSNKGVTDSGRNVFSSATLTAVALTTEINNFELSNDVKRLDTEEITTSEDYEIVRGLTSSLVSLASEGDFYVAASINSRSDGSDTTGEYKLEFSVDAGGSWSDLGKPVRRSMGNNFDEGIISLVGLLQDNKGIHSNYQFRISHRRVSGFNTIITSNVNLVVVALTHSNGYFPTFYSEVSTPGVDISGVSTPSALVTSSDFTSVADIDGVGTGLFVHAQYRVSADGLNESTPQRMRSSNQLFLDQGITYQEPSQEYFRYISNNSSFGSGGFIGLAEDLDSEATYTVSMFHKIDNIYAPDGIEDEVLSTSEVVLAGFQTYDFNTLVLTNDDIKTEDKIKIFGALGKIEIRSTEPINAEIKIYNILGKLISSSRINNQSDTSIDLGNFKGIAIVSIITEGRIITKKVII